MNAAKALVVLAFLLVLGVPLAFRPAAAPRQNADHRIVIITPHNEQIRSEFAAAFSEWFTRNNPGQTVYIDWRQPGGTSDIIKVLRATYSRAISDGDIIPSTDPDAPHGAAMLAPGRAPMPYDLVFGGGSYDHGVELRAIGATATPPGASEPITLAMSVPARLTRAELDEVFAIRDKSGAIIAAGDAANVVSDRPRPESLAPSEHRLYDPDQFWIGTALSGFGIVYNRDALAALGVEPPEGWHDITDPRLAGQLAAADPRQSGSVTTTYESILNNFGWDEGWKLLRRISANARYFSGSSARPPVDVSQGEAAVGLAIDFYGRYQSQAVLAPGQAPDQSRVGYVDPAGAVYIDADPISLMAGAPNPDLARQFIRFVLSDEGQALWNFSIRAEGETLGPQRYELRRMPVRRSLYTSHPDRFVDRADPYALNAPTPSRRWRSAITPMMTAFALDIHEEQRHAWEALSVARLAAPNDSRIGEMEALFDAFPDHEFHFDHQTDKFSVARGTRLPFTPENFAAINADWKAAAAAGLSGQTRVRYTAFFRDNYRRIIRLASRIDR